MLNIKSRQVFVLCCAAKLCYVKAHKITYVNWNFKPEGVMKLFLIKTRTLFLFVYILYCVCFNLYCGGFILFCNVWLCVCVGFVMCVCVCVCVCVSGFVMCGCVCMCGLLRILVKQFVQYLGDYLQVLSRFHGL